MRRNNSIFSLFCLIWVLVSNSCGTETGNPGFSPFSAPDSISYVSILVDAVCERVSTCYSNANAETCVNSLLENNEVDTLLNLPDGVYKDTSEIIQSELGGSISPDPLASNQCISDISALSCSSPELTAAYSEVLAGNYGNIHLAIPSNGGSVGCDSMF